MSAATYPLPECTSQTMARLVSPILMTRLALVDPDLVIAIKGLVDLCEEADWDNARHMANAITQRIRILDLESRATEAGVVTPR